MALPLPEQIDKAKTYVLSGTALIELMKRGKVSGVQNEIVVREGADGEKVIGFAAQKRLLLAENGAAAPYLIPMRRCLAL